MGGLRIHKNSNLKVIGCILFPALLFVIEFKTAEQLRLMPQTAEEHYAQDEDVPNYDSDSSSSSSSSSSSDSSLNEAETSAGDEESRINIGKINKLFRRRRKKSMSAVVNGCNDFIELQKVSIDGARKTDRIHITPDGQIESEKRLPLDVQESLQQQIKIDMPREKVVPNGQVMFENPRRISADNLDAKSIASSRLTKEISPMKKVYEFYNAPITKFWTHTMAFFVFLAFYHWMVLVRLPKVPHWTEVYVICCVFTMSLEVCREVRQLLFLGVGKKFDYLCNRTIFSRPSNENFKLLKNCPHEFYEIEFSTVILHPKVLQ